DLGERNKGTVDLKGQMMGKDVAMKMVSDGEKMKLYVNPPGKEMEQPLPKKFGAMVRTGLCRVGLAASLFLGVRVGPPGTEQEEPDIEKQLRVSDFKLGKNAKVGGRAARVVEYRVSLGEKATAAAKVWIDAN